MDALDRIVPGLLLGDRVVVRYRLADASATDVIGWLDELDDQRVLVTDHRGARTDIARGLVLAARRAPAARGGPDPMRIDADELERITLPGWVADHEPLGSWTLRAGSGFTGRANSCLAVGDPGLPVAEAAERIVSHAVRHRIEPRAQVVVGSEPERALRALGWTETYVRTDVLVTRLGRLLDGTAADPRVHVDDQLSPQWTRAYHRSRPNTADPHVLRRLLAGQPPCGFARVPAERLGSDADGAGELVAIGRGHVSSDWLGLASLWTAPEHRRQGLASAVITALGHWAARLGARNVYLQVATENEPAHRAYERSGFVRHHSYLCLTPTRLRFTAQPRDPAADG